jgi:capping protein alpha
VDKDIYILFQHSASLLEKKEGCALTTTCDTNRKSAQKSLETYVKEHFPNAAYGVYPTENDSKLAIIIVGNKYSPNNFW